MRALIDWQTLDARSLRIYREEAIREAELARSGKELATEFGGFVMQDFAADLEFWEAQQAAIETELTQRGLNFE